jgi:hypothetical protein
MVVMEKFGRKGELKAFKNLVTQDPLRIYDRSRPWLRILTS